MVSVHTCKQMDKDLKTKKILSLFSPLPLPLFLSGLIWLVPLYIVIVIGVTKMRNSVIRAGLKPTSLVFRASVLPLHQAGTLMSPLYPHPPVYVALCLRLLHSFHWNCKFFNAYNYMHTSNGLTYTYIHRVGSTTIQRIACTGSLSWQPVFWVWRKLEILCLELELNPHLWHSGPVCYYYTIRFPEDTSIPTPTCVCDSVPQRSVQTTTLLLVVFVSNILGWVQAMCTYGDLIILNSAVLLKCLSVVVLHPSNIRRHIRKRVY